MLLMIHGPLDLHAVSYTHLDVYKRQDRLIHADQEHRKSIEAMIKGELTGKSIFLEAAEQIVALRNILGITGN